MLNTSAASRRLARRIAVIQAIVTSIVAAGFLADSVRAAAGAALGGLAITVGGALMAWRALSGGVVAAEVAMVKLASGMALKWATVVLVLYLALAQWALDPLAVFSGLLAALVVNLVAIGTSRSGPGTSGPGK
ncbi:MAG: ATP synthase subunit I [Pseudomarimonas sp.]